MTQDKVWKKKKKVNGTVDVSLEQATRTSDKNKDLMGFKGR